MLAAFWGKSKEPGVFCQFEYADSEYVGSHAEICIFDIQKRLLKMLITGLRSVLRASLHLARTVLHTSLVASGCYGPVLWSARALSMICQRECLSTYTRERLNISATAVVCLVVIWVMNMVLMSVIVIFLHDGSFISSKADLR